MRRRLRREDYTVGWVCALSVELAAAEEMLDEEHEDAIQEVGNNDENVYSVGSIAGHNVVIVCLPNGHIGNNSAASVATQMLTAFKGIRFGLMVGIGGGVPSASADIRLGDVVVSRPQGTFGGVVQYGSGRTPNGIERVGSLNSPPQILLNATITVQANAMLNKSTLSNHLSTLERILGFQRREAGPDLLFKATYSHEYDTLCDQCIVENQQPRPERESGEEVKVHYGTIASSNQLIKDAVQRDRVSAELGGVLCFETEAAGLMNSFPCLVIRGISDYADTHKNRRWQAYAAGTAAAYAKELLSVIPAADVLNICRAEDAIGGASKQSLQSPSSYEAFYKRTKSDIFSSSDRGYEEKRATTLSIHHQKPSQAPKNNEQRQALLHSLRFEQIDARQNTIKTAHYKTCRWLLENKQYLNWLDATKLHEHHGFLWIKGKPGTGKSTLMKFALVNAHRTMKDHTVLSFFFNLRGEDIEKSTIGTYRSLLLQLLEHHPALLDIFGSLDISSSSCSIDYQWDAESLRILLEHAVSRLQDSSIVCFIDALDECEEQQIRDMLHFFEHISDIAITNGVHFRICVSSRHYPHITIRKGLELVLEGQEGHSQDITNYIETELKIGKGKLAQQVRAELQNKAAGIFVWVVLVIGILNKEYDNGQVHALRRKLNSIPVVLYNMFNDILTRDAQNRDRLVLCVQWLLFPKQPLSPEELYHALLSIDPDAISQWDPDETTKDDIKRFLLNSSKGLAEATASREPKIRFIHESVRDFLLKENGLSKIWPEFGSNFQGRSHERLKQCCLDYINNATPLNIPSDLPKASSQQAASLRKSATHRLPFLEYAIHNVLYHANTAEGAGISQTNFLVNFPLSKWVKLNNLFEKYEVRRYTERIGLRYILAELNAANLIIVLGEVETERYGANLASGGEDYSDALPNDANSYAQDSGYATAPKETTETLITQDVDNDDVATVVSTFTVNEAGDYVSEIAKDLLDKFAFNSFDSQTLERVYKALHGQLKALALKLGHDTENQQFRNMMVFVYGHESKIVERLKELVSNVESKRPQFNRTQFTQNWLYGNTTVDATKNPEPHVETSAISQHSSHETPRSQPGDGFTEHTNDVADNVDSHEVSNYGRLLFKEPAYTWFLACMDRERSMDPASLDLATAIKKKISDSFPSLRRVSRRRPAQSYTATFQIQWDPHIFIEDEGYKEDAEHVVETAITLTGSLRDAQALTCSQYLNQVWPTSGSKILQLIKSVVASGPGQKHTCSLPDRTKITAWMIESTFMVEAVGTVCSVAEVGEQFAWIGSALRSSPYRHGVVCCTPHLTKDQHSRGTAKTPDTVVARQVKFDIHFSVQSERDQSDHFNRTTCQCWHNMFRNPVIVEGYPIPRRSEANTGLELPLNMMAGLLNTVRANVFDGKVFIKSHGSMLVPTRQIGDMILWHFLRHEHGEPMLYRHNRGPHALIHFSVLENPKMRHIVGWLSEAKILSGASEAAKCVDNSRLKGPFHGCALERARIVKQIYIGHGATISYGNKDGHRGSWNESLESLSKKYVILWDVESKRGWMMNGTTAFLHLLRASLELNRTGQLKSNCLFEQTHIQEAATPEQCDSALQVLLNADNGSLPIFRDDPTRVRDRIKDFIYIFESMFAWEQDSDGKRPGPMKLKGETFEYLEGWDFNDIATRKSPIIPRIEKLKTSGRSWIELSRSLEAVTIFGKGLGELIQPVDANRLCKYWERLPSERYYVAAMVSDVQRMVDEVHNRLMDPRSLFAKILRHQNDKSTEFCQCTEHDSDKHADIVKILKPFNADGEPEEIYWIDKENPGAVCFGSCDTDELHYHAAGGAENIVQPAQLVTRTRPDNLNCDRGQLGNQIATRPHRPIECGPSLKRKRSTPESLDAEGDADNDPILRPNNTIPPCRPDHFGEFQVAIICALTIEADAVQALFDGTWDNPDQPEDDSNAYSTGWIGAHAVVLVHLAGMGKKHAATAAADLKRTCKGIKLALLVGICGGIPSPEKIPEILLGDVVVGTRVMQYDLGKRHETGFISKQTHEQGLCSSNGRIQSFENKVKTLVIQERLRKLAISYMKELCRVKGLLAGKFMYPGLSKDKLYRRNYHHKHRNDAACASGECFSRGREKVSFCESASQATCADLRCDSRKLIIRTRIENARKITKQYIEMRSTPRHKQYIPKSWSLEHPTITSSESWIHFGDVASGDTVMKSSKARDKIAEQYRGLRAFEMECTGIWGTLPTIMVKGVCDYSDSHKNDDWHWYAAGTAAACTKALLHEWPVLQPHVEQRLYKKARYSVSA